MIRRAEPNDVAAIVAIERQSFGDPWSASSFRQILDREEVVFLVLVDEGAVIGYSVVYIGGDHAELANIAIAPTHRRSGRGYELLVAVVAAAERSGAEAVWLEVRASNLAAQALYQRAGFVHAGVRKRYYSDPSEDAMVMRKSRGIE